MNDQSHDAHDEGTTVSEAARILGITEGAVRKRVERGKLAAEHTQDGRLMVYLGRDTTTTDTTRDRPRQSRDSSEADDRYIRSLEEQVQYLRLQLDQEREARTEERRRQDTVVAQLSRANEEQARTIRELEAPAESILDERETPQKVEEEPERTEFHHDAPRAQASTQHQQAQRPTEGVEHDTGTLREWTGDGVEARRSTAGQAQEGAQRRSWWRRVFGG